MSGGGDRPGQPLRGAGAAARKPLDQSGPPSLERHPRDGWNLAAPWPMRRSTRRAFRALIAALLPPAPAPRPSGIEDRIEDSVRRLMRYMAPLVARLLVLVIHLLDWSPLLTFRARHRLRRLSPARAAAVLTSLSASRLTFLRQLVMAARGAVLSAYFDEEEVHRAMGYAPVPFMRERIALRERLRHGARPTEVAT